MSSCVNRKRSKGCIGDGSCDNFKSTGGNLGLTGTKLVSKVIDYRTVKVCGNKDDVLDVVIVIDTPRRKRTGIL